MLKRLDHYRIRADLTIEEMASRLKIDRNQYYELRDGDAHDAKMLKRIETLLGCTAEQLRDDHAPIGTRIYDTSAGEHLEYWGDAAIHFQGGGKPLLLRISSEEHATLFEKMQDTDRFFVVRSLSNQTVLVRRRAIQDLYLSSEAYDYFGPEHDDYVVHPQIPDARDWRILELIEMADSDDEDAQHQRMMKYLEDLPDGESTKVLDLAARATIQYSNGKERKVYIQGEQAMYEAFDGFLSSQEAYDESDSVFWDAEGGHRTMLIPLAQIDYIALPTHQLEEGEDQYLDEQLREE